MQSASTVCHDVIAGATQPTTTSTTAAAATAITAPAIPVTIEVVFVQASALRKGGYLMVKGKPCKITEMTTHKTGKHGGAKINFTAIGILDGKKREMIAGSKERVDCPVLPAQSKGDTKDTTAEHVTALPSKSELKAQRKAVAAGRLAARKARKQAEAAAGADADAAAGPQNAKSGSHDE